MTSTYWEQLNVQTKPVLDVAKAEQAGTPRDEVAKREERRKAVSSLFLFPVPYRMAYNSPVSQ